MKKVFVVLCTFLCICSVLSCDKLGNDINEEQLEGKWWVPTRGEGYFNGTYVVSEQLTDFQGYSKAFFEKGTCSVIKTKTGEQINFQYTFSNNTLSIGDRWIREDYRLIKLTKTEAVVERTFDEQDTFTSFSSGKVIGQYNGIDIYESENGGYHWHWYYNKNGKAVLCFKNINNDYIDTAWIYFKAE